MEAQFITTYFCVCVCFLTALIPNIETAELHLMTRCKVVECARSVSARLGGFVVCEAASAARSSIGLSCYRSLKSDAIKPTFTPQSVGVRFMGACERSRG